MPIRPRVLIVGDGIAASALACLLRESAIDVDIAARSHPASGPPVIEALPQAAVGLLAEIGLGAALSAATPVTVDGFDNRFHHHTHRVAGIWTHVDREALARQCLRSARYRGAVLTDGQSPTRADIFAVIDATGRAARYSRPIHRARSATATIFIGPAHAAHPRPGCIVRDELGWVYRLDHPSATTVGVVTERTPVDTLDERTAASVGADSATLRRTGVRSCSVQWSADPIGPRRIAVGDAALALNPVAGQGVRFALSSAIAAAAVIRTWADGGDKHAADDYYRRFVDGVRARHVANLSTMLDAAPHEGRGPDRDAVALDPTALLSFSATATTTGQNRGGRIVVEEAFCLPDGGLVRFVGGVDLTWLRDATACDATVTDVCRQLTARDVNPRTVGSLLAWAVHNGVLTATSP